MTSTTTGARPAGGAARGRDAITVSGAVSAALAAGRPVVALESTIFSRLGLPAPANGDALRRCLAAVRAGGAEPAVTAILDGKARVGLEPGEEERVLAGSRKVAERDIAVAAAQGLEVGVTTVSASVALAHAAGIQVFATGGIGGVHRGAELTGDISADLDALASHPVVTVCAGAKAFLDLARTLEYLETAGVPVLGWQHDWFPAFYLRSSGLPVPHRVETARVVADVLRGRTREYTGVLLTVPIPPADELAPGPLNAALDAALAACEAARITGAAVTPFVLERIERQTAGASVPANLALAENNARVAALVAAALAVALPGMPVLAGDARVPGNDRFVERPAVADQERRVRQDEPGLPPGDRGLKRHARVFGLDRVAGGETGVRPRPHLLGSHPERDRPHGVAHAQPFARPADGGCRGDVVLERPVDLDRGKRRPVAQVVRCQAVGPRLSGLARGACVPGGGLSHRRSALPRPRPRTSARPARTP
ncbi:MAG: pseudouridylate synthase [Trebonia sp.]|nr:pseudouridylate synthase [Trebonia sp.]